MQKLKTLRKASGMSAYELSKQAGLATNVVYVIEKRSEAQQSVGIMVNIARTIAKKLNRPVQDVLFEICTDEDLKGGQNADQPATNGTAQPRTRKNRRVAAPD
ncbi:transcriptional regulator [Deinococcus misasensis]|uniref:transcriptional regulator n=1 Tax=Deinococcus misasensis TaxID=392413 RepID=UPI0005511573|nr:transcriptional regulator [Deinococcus misasensis]